MAMMLNERNIMGNAAALRAGARRLMRQAREDVSSALLVVGFVTCVTVVVAASSLSRASETTGSLLANPVYLGAFLGAFFGGLGTMWAAIWVADDAARRRATGRIILGASMLPMVMAFGVGPSNDSNRFDILRALA